VNVGSSPDAVHLTPCRSERGAVLMLFFVNGAALATWLSLIPSVQQKLALDAGELGVALLGLSVGAVVATSSTGWLVGRAGGPRVATLAAVAFGRALRFDRRPLQRTPMTPSQATCGLRRHVM
jgi:hypothetical protein